MNLVPLRGILNSEFRILNSEVLIGKALSIFSLVTYFRHPALGVLLAGENIGVNILPSRASINFLNSGIALVIWAVLQLSLIDYLFDFETALPF